MKYTRTCNIDGFVTIYEHNYKLKLLQTKESIIGCVILSIETATHHIKHIYL